jgi:hypothetical protein
VKRIAFLAFVVVAIMAGCLGGPAQKLDQTQKIAPDTSSAAKLNDVTAQTLAIAQQNTVAIQAIQKSQQNTDAQQAKIAGNLDTMMKVNAATASDVGTVKAGIANITQNQFRLESWLAESTDGWRVHCLGVDTYHPGNPADAVAPVIQGSGGNLVGKLGSVPDGAGNVRGGTGPHGGRPVPAAQGSDSAPITKGGEKHMPTWLVIVLTVIGTAVVYGAAAALRQVILIKEATAKGNALIAEKILAEVLGAPAVAFEALVGIVVHVLVADHPGTTPLTPPAPPGPALSPVKTTGS